MSSAVRVIGVTELNEHIKSLLDADARLSAVYVRGELSNYKTYPSGHHYFTLKDQNSALRCVFFKREAAQLRFRPENGMSVVAFGRVSVFPRDGAYQLYVSELSPDGVGDLHVAYEQLKEKLLGEGLFDAGRKKPLPSFPGTIAVITSPAGAAVRDVIRVLGARWPLARVKVLPVRVQGAEAPGEIADAIGWANRYSVADLIITGRGGGSIEDLWAFNDERVARAIFASAIPVISAVGHEPDVTIADFVADVRAATPSNAAELAVPDAFEVGARLASLELRAAQTLRRSLSARRARLDALSVRRCLTDPMSYIDDKRQLLDMTRERLAAAASRGLHRGRERFARAAASLDALSPLRVLGRGYAIVRSPSGAIVKAASDVASGDIITARLKKDEIKCRVM
ncbi:MAG: exodeoxyribonuclease VII large subunit [Oscillospiraceae bacterium]|nr:exodeoxyribonuclease VII large subunit [Oscillospiraceae bacterium]